MLCDHITKSKQLHRCFLPFYSGAMRNTKELSDLNIWAVFVFSKVFCHSLLITFSVFSLNNSYHWEITVLGVLGFNRGLMQSTLILSFSDELGDKFSEGYSMMLFLSSGVVLALGVLQSKYQMILVTTTFQMVFRVFMHLHFFVSFTVMKEGKAFKTQSS